MWPMRIRRPCCAPTPAGRSFTVVSPLRSPPVWMLKGGADAAAKIYERSRPHRAEARAAQHQAVALIVVGAPVVVVHVEVVLRRAEECIAGVVQRLRQRVRRPMGSPPAAGVPQRQRQPVIVGAADALVLAVVAHGADRAGQGWPRCVPRPLPQSASAR